MSSEVWTHYKTSAAIIILVVVVQRVLVIKVGLLNKSYKMPNKRYKQQQQQTTTAEKSINSHWSGWRARSKVKTRGSLSGGCWPA